MLLIRIRNYRGDIDWSGVTSLVIAGLFVLGFIAIGIREAFWPAPSSSPPPAGAPSSAEASPEAPPQNPYLDGTLKQRVFTAEVDIRIARKLFEEGRQREAYAVLEKAEDKYALGEQGKADLTKLKEMVLEVESRNSAFIKEVRRKRAASRLKSKAERTHAALQALEYRSRVWGEVLDIVQGRLRRQAPGAESYVESPFRVDPAFLLDALSRRYGKTYLETMRKAVPGVLEQALRDAEALGEPAVR